MPGGDKERRHIVRAPEHYFQQMWSSPIEVRLIGWLRMPQASAKQASWAKGDESP